MNTEKLNELIESYGNLKDELRTGIINYLKEILEVREGKRMYFKEIDNDYDCAMGSAMLTYDGGNHPEYASNAFSEVYGMYLYEDGTLCFDIEDSEYYGVERVWSLDELIGIKDVVDYLLEVEKSEE